MKRMRKRLPLLLALLLCLVLPPAMAEAVPEGTAASSDAASGGRVLTRFFFTRGGSMVPQTREVCLEESGYILRENGEEPRPLDPALAGALEQLVLDCGLEAWNGFHGSSPFVLDGESFRLEMAFSDGTSAEASGENAFPDGYYAAVDRLEALFRQEKAAFLSGVYRYEGEGFGGDFTLTLNPDGTFSFSEGPLSSFLGTGSWYADPNAVWLQEESGSGLQFSFAPENGALLFLASCSDPFPRIRVAEGERFVRISSAEAAMRLIINGTEVPVTWEDNASTAALRELLPLTVRMSMYGGFEQVGPIGRELPREDLQTTTEAGDIVLYAGSQLVIFYGANSWAYTRLGHVDLPQEEMAGLLAHGDAVVELVTD